MRPFCPSLSRFCFALASRVGVRSCVGLRGWSSPTPWWSGLQLQYSNSCIQYSYSLLCAYWIAVRVLFYSCIPSRRLELSRRSLVRLFDHAFRRDRAYPYVRGSRRTRRRARPVGGPVVHVSCRVRRTRTTAKSANRKSANT